MGLLLQNAPAGQDSQEQLEGCSRRNTWADFVHGICRTGRARLLQGKESEAT